MGADLEAAWHHPAANAVTRKRIIRVVLREVVARVEDDQIQLLLHWQGGDHTRLTVRKNRRGQTRWSVEPETMELIRACARLMPDKAIAGMLNRTGKRTGRLNGWTQSRVRGFRNTHGISVYVNGEWAERAEAVLRPTMKFVAIKTVEQLDLQGLHRVRERLVCQRPSVINLALSRCSHRDRVERDRDVVRAG
jgi:hypothetical protein